MASVLATHDGFDQGLVRAWDELAGRTDAHPFLRPGWFIPWWRAFGEGRPHIVTVRRGDQLTAVAPMGRTAASLVSASNWHTPMFGFLAEDVRSAEELASATLRRSRCSATVRFVDEEDRLTDEALVGAAKGRIRRRLLESSPFIDTRGDWAAYETALRAGHRRELRRRWRRLAELGDVSFAVHRGEQDLDRLLDEGLRVEGSGWKDARGTAIRAQPATRRFYTEIAEWAADGGWLVLGFLRLDGQPVAFDFCLEHKGTHYLLKTGYDTAYRQLAPGMLLRQEMIRRAFRDGVDTYDFLGDDSDWKRDWTNRTRSRWELRAYPTSPLGTLTYLADRYGRPAAGRLRRAVAARRAS